MQYIINQTNGFFWEDRDRKLVAITDYPLPTQNLFIAQILLKNWYVQFFFEDLKWTQEKFYFFYFEN